MSLSLFLLRLLGSTFLAYATAVGTALSQYKGDDLTKPGVCSSGYAPAWMCEISGVTGATGVLGRVTGFVTGIAAGVGVCVFIYACIQMVMSQGQEDKMTAAKKMAMIALVGVFLTLSVQMIFDYLSWFFWEKTRL